MAKEAEKKRLEEEKRKIEEAKERSQMKISSFFKLDRSVKRKVSLDSSETDATKLPLNRFMKLSFTILCSKECKLDEYWQPGYPGIQEYS